MQQKESKTDWGPVIKDLMQLSFLRNTSYGFTDEVFKTEALRILQEFEKSQFEMFAREPFTEAEETVLFVAKWVERGLYSENVPAETALKAMAYYCKMPWNNNIPWDVDHKEYKEEFYRDFPNARPKNKPANVW